MTFSDNPFRGSGNRCKNMCERSKISVRFSKGDASLDAVKRCTYCDVYLRTESYKCECCGHLLRNRPRSRKTRGEYVDNS